MQGLAPCAFFKGVKYRESPRLVTRYSPWLGPLQVGSRLGVLWAAVWAIPEVRQQQLLVARLPFSVGGQQATVDLALGVSSMFIAWSLSEIIRYSFYFCKVRRASGLSAGQRACVFLPSIGRNGRQPELTGRAIANEGVGICAVHHHLAAVHGLRAALPNRCGQLPPLFVAVSPRQTTHTRACMCAHRFPGVASELAVIYFALPYVRERKMFTVEMPNAWNFAVDDTVWVRLIAFGYITGFPMVRAPRISKVCALHHGAVL